MLDLSGIGVYIDNILDTFINEYRQERFLLIGDSNKLGKYRSSPNFTIFDTRIKIFSFNEFFSFPVSEINKCDIFFTPNYNIPGGIRIPIMSMIHDVVFLDIKGLTSGVGRILRWLYLYRAIKISKVIFTVSDFSRQRIAFHFKKTKEIVVVKGGVRRDLKNYENDIDKIYDFKYILFIGNIKKHKGLSILLSAYSKALEMGFDKKLVIVGNSRNFRTSDKKVAGLLKKQDRNLIFSGNKSNKDLFNIISNASLLVQPSVYEGFGLPPIEAMYLGCNVLISDIPVFREIYQNLPVEYFELTDIQMLAEKMISSSEHKRLDLDLVRPLIDKNYDLKISARKIMSYFKKFE